MRDVDPFSPAYPVAPNCGVPENLHKTHKSLLKPGISIKYNSNFLKPQAAATLGGEIAWGELFMDRYWLGISARLLVGVLVVAWAASYMGTGSGEKEFQKTLDAMKQVHTFRVAFAATPAANMHNEMLWEVDCGRNLVHQQMHLVSTGEDSPHDINEDQLSVSGHDFSRQADGSWTQSRYGNRAGNATAICNYLAQGTDSNLLPPIATMIKRGIIQKGDKKTVNGVRCREWTVTMKGGLRGLEHDTLCLGVDDHLPYEMTVDWENSRASFSDYNKPIQFEIPEAVVQATSTSAGSN